MCIRDSSIAENKGRWQELQRQATTAQLYDVDVRILDKNQIKKDYPIVNTDDVIGGILMPGDGAADPSGVTHMLAKAARKEGAQIFEKSPVEEIITKDGKISGVNDSGPEKNFLIPAVSNIGNLFKAEFK